jgi:hypothetical protein
LQLNALALLLISCLFDAESAHFVFISSYLIHSLQFMNHGHLRSAPSAVSAHAILTRDGFKTTSLTGPADLPAWKFSQEADVTGLS